MIINQTNYDYSAKYAKLFQDAFNLLKDEGKLIPEDAAKNTFTSLEEYFMYIGDLAQIHGSWVQGAMEDPIAANWNEKFAKYSRYLMIPLDEDVFKINANSRTISVPSIFAQNGVSLVGDQRAETLIFEVDRYFDFIDLLRTNIYVQWTNPAGLEGATLVHLVDYDDKKIRFGWTLSDKVTVGGGNNLTFSIRFFMRNDSKEIIYSLNTLPASVKVKPALRITIEETFTDEAPYLFVEAIMNGADSKSGDDPLQAIIFKNLPEELVYLAEDAHLFEIGAYPADTGELSYQWQFIPYNDVNNVTTLTTDASKGIVISVDMVEKPTTETTMVAKKRYYVVDDKSPSGYSLTDDEAFVAGTTYYVPMARCAINPSADNLVIAGQYSCNVINTIKKNTMAKKSVICTIPHPKTITYAKNLVANDLINILTLSNAEDPASEKIVALSVATSPDDNHANQSYEWYKITSAADVEKLVNKTSDTEGVKINDATSTAYTAKEPGWYYVKTKNTLNRVTIEENSIVAKVTNAAVAPTIADITGEPVSINFGTINTATSDIVVNASVDAGELDPQLVSEGLTYEWLHQMKENDEEYESVKVGEYGVVAIDNHILTVKYAGDSELFKCKVINTLNKNTATAYSDTYVVMKTKAN
jgi:hypothetical protein